MRDILYIKGVLKNVFVEAEQYQMRDTKFSDFLYGFCLALIIQLRSYTFFDQKVFSSVFEPFLVGVYQIYILYYERELVLKIGLSTFNSARIVNLSPRFNIS